MITFFKIHRVISSYFTLCIITEIKLYSTVNVYVRFTFMYFQEQRERDMQSNLSRSS